MFKGAGSLASIDGHDYRDINSSGVLGDLYFFPIGEAQGDRFIIVEYIDRDRVGVPRFVVHPRVDGEGQRPVCLHYGVVYRGDSEVEGGPVRGNREVEFPV